MFTKLHLRATIGEVDAIVKKAKGDWAYAKDREFAAIVMGDVVTYEQAKALIVTLEADRYAMEGNRNWKCSKARSMADSLAYWRKSSFLRDSTPAGEFIASARRTCCGCHEQGSFALSDYYRRTMEGKAKERKEKTRKRVQKMLA